MARSLQVRRRWWVLAAIVGIGLVAWYVWWSTRLARAVDRIVTRMVTLQHKHPMAAPVDRIPDAWVPELMSEMVRDDTALEDLRLRVQRRVPSKLIPPFLWYYGSEQRRGSAVLALAVGRGDDEVLRTLESVFPKAPTAGAQWIITAYDELSTEDHPGRRSLFLTASRNPDPQVRLASVALVAGNLNTGKNGDRSDGPAWDRLRELLDDQVSVVREAAGLALAEAAAR